MDTKKILVGVPSCHFLKQYEEVIQSTWGKDIPPDVDLRFFLGNPEVPLAVDEVFLKVEDGFDSLTNKTVALYAWALEQGYEFVFKCDLDTLVRPKLLLSSGLDAYDWVGGQNSFFASGGGGYGLSRKAMQYVVAAGGAPGFEEDVHIARILLSHGIELHADPRFKFCPGDVMDDATITFHLSSIRAWYYKGYRPEMMLEAWEDQKTRNYRSYVEPLVNKRWLRRLK